MFSYLQQPSGFYKRLFLLALPIQTGTGSSRESVGIRRIHSGKWVHDITRME